MDSGSVRNTRERCRGGRTDSVGVSGTLSAFEDRAADLLATHGIEEPQPGEWYPQRAWLDAAAEIADTVGEQTLKQIGGSIPDSADWPAAVTTVAAGVKSIDDGKAVVRCTNPYPCAFDRGVLDAVVARTTSAL